MIVIPAIDLRGGLVVRLLQGKFAEQTIYSDNPAQVAKDWERQGAKLIHVVDLDGAEKGQIKNLSAIKEIVAAVKIPIEVGGGIRTREDILRLLEIGVSRIILGTKALEDEAFVKDCVNTWQERIVVSIDCSHGKVANKGWTSISCVKAADLAKKIESFGVKEIIYTEISRDGTLLGPNISAIKLMLESVKLSVIASGGVSSLDDIKKLKELEAQGLKAVIIGKALYEGVVNLREAIKICSPSA